MRLRPCQDDARIQCDLCEVIRIVDTEAYASSPEHQTNSIECSDVNVHEVIDCPENSVYLDEIARNCNGTQTCELNCSSLVNTESCCMEISYTCERRRCNVKYHLIATVIVIKHLYSATSDAESFPTQVSAITNKM